MLTSQSHNEQGITSLPYLRLTIVVLLISGLAVLLLVPDGVTWAITLWLVGLLTYCAIEFPEGAIYLLLITGWMPLRLLTGTEKNILSSLGGVNVEGLRLVGTVAVLGIWALAHMRWTLGQLRAYWPYVVFLLWSAVTWLWSPEKGEGLRLLLKLIYPFLAFIMARYAIKTDFQRTMVHNVLTAVAVLMLLWIVVRRVLGEPWMIELMDSTRFQGTSSPAVFALEAGIILVYLLLVQRRRLMWLNQVLFVILLILTILTLTRGVLLTLTVLALAVPILWSINLVRDVKYIALVALLALGWLYGPMQSRIDFDFASEPEQASTEDDTEASNRSLRTYSSGRSEAWGIAIDMFEDNPLIGAGIGAAPAAVGRELMPWLNTVLNEHLRLLAEIGLVGYLLVNLAYGQLAIRIIPLTAPRWLPATIDSDTASSIMARIALAGLIYAFVLGATADVFNFYADLMLYIWIYVAVALPNSGPQDVQPAAQGKQ